MENWNGLQNKIFKIILLLGLILSGFSIIGNILFGFPFEVNIKWLFLIILSIVGIILNILNIESLHFRFFFFLGIILVLIPYGWIDSGGSNNNTIAYVFLVMMSVTFLIQKSLRTILVILLICTFVSLFCLEHFYPGFVKVHSTESQFLDRLIQIPLTLIAGFLMLKQFANAYIEEKERLDQSSKELKAANERLEWMANRDGLTGVYNRRAFDARLSELIEKEMPLVNDIWIILLDLDFFKTINDTYGHTSGDQVICALAEHANQIMPEASFISRWGGDEFSIIYWGNLAELKSNMNKFYQTENRISIDNQMTITLSAGITKLEKNDIVSSVLKRVDMALYQSKNDGRNQYTVL